MQIYNVTVNMEDESFKATVERDLSDEILTSLALTPAPLNESLKSWLNRVQKVGLQLEEIKCRKGGSSKPNPKPYTNTQGNKGGQPEKSRSQDKGKGFRKGPGPNSLGVNKAAFDWAQSKNRCTRCLSTGHSYRECKATKKLEVNISSIST